MPKPVELMLRGRDPALNPSALTYAHGAVHNDTIISYTETQASSSGRRYLLRTGEPLACHLTLRVIGDKACTIKLYEDPTVTAAGTQVTPRRLHRSSLKTTQALLYHTPTTSALGLLVYDGFNGGGGTGAGARGGDLIHDDAEWLLKVDTDYLLVIADGSSLTFMVEMEWYEVPA
jgi:hypothetical protein